MPFLIAGGVGLVVLVGAIAAFVGRDAAPSAPGAAQGTRGSEDGATVAEIAALDLSATPEQLAKRLGVRADESGVRVNLSGAKFASVGFYWDKDHLEHVRQISLEALPSGVPPDVIERSKAQLGRTLRPAATGGLQFSAGGLAGLSIGSGVYANVNGFDDPRWKQRMTAMFTVLKGAALGTRDVLDERTKRDVLNLDYPLARLAELDTGVTVEAAEREVRRFFPGAVSAGERHDVGLGHPWLESAMVLWNNEQRGKFNRVNLYFAPEFDFKAQREDLVRCLTPALGEPRVVTSNHVAGEVTLFFDAKGKETWSHVSNQVIQLRPLNDSATAKAAFAKALVTLSACR